MSPSVGFRADRSILESTDFFSPKRGIALSIYSLNLLITWAFFFQGAAVPPVFLSDFWGSEEFFKQVNGGRYDPAGSVTCTCDLCYKNLEKLRNFFLSFCTNTVHAPVQGPRMVFKFQHRITFHVHVLNKGSINLDRLIGLSESSLLDSFLEVSLIVTIKGRSQVHVSLIVIIKQVSAWLSLAL